MRELSCRSAVSSRGALNMLPGTVPLKLLKDTSSSVRLGSPAQLARSSPEMLLFDRSMILSCRNAPARGTVCNDTDSVKQAHNDPTGQLKDSEPL